MTVEANYFRRDNLRLSSVKQVNYAGRVRDFRDNLLQYTVIQNKVIRKKPSEVELTMHLIVKSSSNPDGSESGVQTVQLRSLTSEVHEIGCLNEDVSIIALVYILTMWSIN